MKRVSTQIFLPVLLSLGSQLYGQNITGSMSGRIVDPSGAAIPDATVIANESARKTSVKTVTTTQGDFSLAGLSPGTYTITVEASGFRCSSTKRV